MCCWGAFFNLVWKESCSCTLRLLWDVKQSTVSGNDQVIHFASTVLVCSKMLCRCIYHLISEGAGTEHTQPLSKDRNGWRQWDWNEKRLKILEQIPVSFIIVSTNGDTAEDAMTGRLEKRRGLLTTDAFAVLPLSVTRCRRKPGLGIRKEEFDHTMQYITELLQWKVVLGVYLTKWT